MASIHPFQALRPAPDAAPSVSSVPYDVVSTDEARQLAAGNPLSFLHVTRSEIDFPPDADPYSSEVYDKARANLDALRANAPLVVDDVRNTGQTQAHCVELVRKAGGTVIATAEIYDRMEALVDAGVPNFALAEYKAPDNVPAAQCPMCRAGTPITTF